MSAETRYKGDTKEKWKPLKSSMVSPEFRIFYSFNSGDDKKRHGHYKHGDTYNLSYGEKIEEQRVITSERFHAKSYDGVNYPKEQKDLSIPLSIFKEHTKDKEKCNICKK